MQRYQGNPGLDVEPILGSVGNHHIHYGLHSWLLLFNYLVVKAALTKILKRI